MPDAFRLRRLVRTLLAGAVALACAFGDAAGPLRAQAATDDYGVLLDGYERG